MLHPRIITPPDLTATVLRELADDPGVTHITADRGAARQPPGDLVSCDLVRASVNLLIRRLRSAGVTERGGITMTELETVISTTADRAQQQILAPEIDATEAFTAWVRSRETRSGHGLWLENESKATSSMVHGGPPAAGSTGGMKANPNLVGQDGDPLGA